MASETAIRCDSPPDTPPVIRVIAMPADTNPAGDMFGGWLMSQMDLAAGSVAAKRAQGRCATIAVESITFHSPVLVGDEVTLWGEIVKSGRTSITINVEAWRRSRYDDDMERVTAARFTFVAIGENRKPRPLPME